MILGRLESESDRESLLKEQTEQVRPLSQSNLSVLNTNSDEETMKLSRFLA